MTDFSSLSSPFSLLKFHQFNIKLICICHVFFFFFCILDADRRSVSTMNLSKHTDPVITKRLSCSSATLLHSPDRGNKYTHTNTVHYIHWQWSAFDSILYNLPLLWSSLLWQAVKHSLFYCDYLIRFGMFMWLKHTFYVITMYYVACHSHLVNMTLNPAES